jgi:Domain of unknown function (DUF1883)
MADFIHAREYLEAGSVVIVDCSHRCNVCVMDDANFSAYRSGRRFSHYGGHFTYFPTRIAVPSAGYWNVTIDLGGGNANIRYRINYLKAA